MVPSLWSVPFNAGCGPPIDHISAASRCCNTGMVIGDLCIEGRWLTGIHAVLEPWRSPWPRHSAEMVSQRCDNREQYGAAACSDDQFADNPNVDVVRHIIRDDEMDLAESTYGDPAQPAINGAG